jgi:hypothetical protein
VAKDRDAAGSSVARTRCITFEVATRIEWFGKFEELIHALGNSPRQSDGIEALLVRPRTAWKMLGCGNTRGYELLAAGELDSFRDGGARKITVESIHRYIERHLRKESSLQKGTSSDRGCKPS